MRVGTMAPQDLSVYVAFLLLALCVVHRVSCWICNKGLIVLVRVGGGLRVLVGVLDHCFPLLGPGLCGQCFVFSQRCSMFCSLLGWFCCLGMSVGY